MGSTAPPSTAKRPVARQRDTLARMVSRFRPLWLPSAGVLGLLLVSSPLDILEPTSIGSILPLWQEILWAVMLAVGGVLTLVGLIAPSKAADV